MAAKHQRMCSCTLRNSHFGFFVHSRFNRQTQCIQFLTQCLKYPRKDPGFHGGNCLKGVFPHQDHQRICCCNQECAFVGFVKCFLDAGPMSKKVCTIRMRPSMRCPQAKPGLKFFIEAWLSELKLIELRKTVLIKKIVIEGDFPARSIQWKNADDMSPQTSYAVIFRCAYSLHAITYIELTKILVTRNGFVEVSIGKKHLIKPTPLICIITVGQRNRKKVLGVQMAVFRVLSNANDQIRGNLKNTQLSLTGNHAVIQNHIQGNGSQRKPQLLILQQYSFGQSVCSSVMLARFT